MGERQQSPWERGGGSTDWKIKSTPASRGTAESPLKLSERGESFERRPRRRPQDTASQLDAAMTPRQALNSGRALRATDRVHYLRQMASSSEFAAALSPRSLDLDAKVVSSKRDDQGLTGCDERIECLGKHPENLVPHRRRDINCPV